MQRPEKPYAGFPLSANLNGQWWKKIDGKPYYFGKWSDDAKGERALADYNLRLPGIREGTDRLRHVAGQGGDVTLGSLLKAFLGQCKLDAEAGSMARSTYGGYIEEGGAFVEWAGIDTPVAGLKPNHFRAYHQDELLGKRKLRVLARKRTLAYVRRMFRWGNGNVNGCPAVNFGDGFKAPKTTPEALRQEKARLGLKDNSKRILSGAEIDAILDKAQPNMRAMILLAVNAGLGPADLGRMKWSHVNLETGVLDFPRGKNGFERRGYLWTRTRDAIRRAAETKHAKLQREKGNDLVFVTRRGLAYYREWDRVEGGKVTGVQRSNTVSLTFSRLVRKLKGMDGVSFYRLRHTFKTLGKKARDPDALNLAMGHEERTTGATYDHEEISFKRLKRVALKVKARLWPKPKAGTQAPTMRLAS